MPWYWMVLDGIGNDAMLCDASRCDVMVLVRFIWMGWVRMAMAVRRVWDGDGDDDAL